MGSWWMQTTPPARHFPQTLLLCSLPILFTLTPPSGAQAGLTRVVGKSQVLPLLPPGGGVCSLREG